MPKSTLKVLSMVLLFTSVIISACSDHHKNEFPPITSSDSLKSHLLLCLEDEFETDKNNIYGATNVMVWQELKNHMDSIISIDNERLNTLNSSIISRNSMNKDEYTSRSEVHDGTIRVHSIFQKDLPFSLPLNSYETIFKNDSVHSFGFNGYEKQASIEYYRSDRDFALKLQPQDAEHEIIVIFSPKKLNSLLAYIKLYAQNQASFIKSQSEKNYWKYQWLPDDQVRIPKVKFHMDHAFNDIIQSQINTTSTSYSIEAFYQRIGFILNENGAKVVSESYAEAAESAEEELPKPKHMIIDSDFVVMLKHKDREYPYFAAYITNTKLLEEK